VRFRLFGTRVEVLAGYWIMTVVFALPYLSATRVPEALIFAAIMFVSILVHEFGHVGAFRANGIHSHVELGTMGGLTIPSTGGRLRRGQQVIVSLAGPFAGFALAAIAFGVERLLVRQGHPPSGLLDFFFWTVLWVNLLWGVFNLLPILPLDGGHVMEAILGPRRLRQALIVSTGASLAAAIYFVTRNQIWGTVLFAMTGWGSYQRLRGLEPEPPPRRTPPPRRAPPRAGWN